MNGVTQISESAADDQGWLPLERGVEIQFQPGGLYRTGDHWLIPARVVTGDSIWPANIERAGGYSDAGHRSALTVLGFGARGIVDFFTPCGCTRVALCPP
jgi:hypothetical protein